MFNQYTTELLMYEEAALSKHQKTCCQIGTKETLNLSATYYDPAGRGRLIMSLIELKRGCDGRRGGAAQAVAPSSWRITQCRDPC